MTVTLLEIMNKPMTREMPMTMTVFMRTVMNIPMIRMIRRHRWNNIDTERRERHQK